MKVPHLSENVVEAWTSHLCTLAKKASLFPSTEKTQMLASLLSDNGVTDLQFRSDSHVRLQTAHGLELVERFGRLSPLDLVEISLLLLRCRNYGDGAEESSPTDEFIRRMTAERSIEFSCEGGHFSDGLPSHCRLRVQCFLDVTGIGITARRLHDYPQELELLGFGDETVLHLQSLLSRNSGLCLVTGQTGAGKSTTLAAMLHWQRSHFPRHIVTVEDPIEYRFSDQQSDGRVFPSLVTQQEVGTHVDSFRQGLIDALRKHPHVIMMGEIRDRQTMGTVLEAIQTGHLVLSTLHTRGAASTIRRVLEFFEPAERDAILSQLSEALLFVLSQGLFPSSRNPKEQILCYEFLQNDSNESRSAIRKYADNPTILSDCLTRKSNRRWMDSLNALVDDGLVARQHLSGVE